MRHKNTEKQRAHQANHAPKPQQKGKSQRIIRFYYREDRLWLGVDHKKQNETKNKQTSNHTKHISKTSTKGQRGRTLF